MFRYRKYLRPIFIIIFGGLLFSPGCIEHQATCNISISIENVDVQEVKKNLKNILLHSSNIKVSEIKGYDEAADDHYEKLQIERVSYKNSNNLNIQILNLKQEKIVVLVFTRFAEDNFNLNDDKYISEIIASINAIYRKVIRINTCTKRI